MDGSANDTQHCPDKTGGNAPKEEKSPGHPMGSVDISGLPMKLEEVIALEEWISGQVEAEPIGMEDGEWHEALASAKEKRRDAERLLARARVEREEAARMMEEVRKAEIRAHKDSMKAEEEGEARAAAVLGQARLTEREYARSVEDAKKEFRFKLEELETLKKAHRQELETVTRILREGIQKDRRKTQESPDLTGEQGSDAAGPVSVVREDPSQRKNQSKEAPDGE